MWLWGEQWEEKEKKKKKSRGHSTLDLVHLPMPATRPLDFHSNRVGHRAGRGMTTTIGKPREFPPRPFRFRPSPFNVEFRLFPSFFFFFCQSKKREEREERETSRSVLSSDSFVKSWHRLFPRYFVHIFARESRRNGSSGDAWNPASPFLPLSLPLPLSRGIYEREKVSRSCNVSRASSMESRFLKGSGMGETREIFNRNRLDP